MSDSAKLRMTSRKEGTEPVVMALTRGMVMVGEEAWAVKGMAEPFLINCWVNLKPDGSPYTKSLKKG